MVEGEPFVKAAEPKKTAKGTATKAADKPAAKETPTAAPSKPAAAAATTTKATPTVTGTAVVPGARVETRVKMSKMRLRIAERLKDSQNTAAMLTTFNEIDMENIINLRNKHKEAFEKKHGVKLGFMSAFVKASSAALAEFPSVNGVIDGDHIVYRDYHDISVAVATPTGLVVPVLRNVEGMGFADIEKTIAEFGAKAREGNIALEDMQGGTFTVSNGGVYGSMMGTPIINPPQSAILGMHGTTKRAVVVGDEIKIRPMMYVALTYDHRIIDGREAVLFLRKIKAVIEDPTILLLDL
jgi:2-oxoglutarate dehydrogenase E2 component (dihydrolipoamide succinyltransferase)